MTFKQKVRNELTKQGRKNIWLAEQMGMHRKTLWEKLKNKTLSNEEKAKILSLLES